jgi:hypothetical protein
MSADADLNAQTWSFDPKVLNGLANALRVLNDEADGFTFQAIWIGDDPETRGRVPFGDVIADVLNNRIRNKHVYLVGKVADQPAA